MNSTKMILIINIALSSVSWAQQNTPNWSQTAKETVEEFCKNEFACEPWFDRLTYAKIHGPTRYSTGESRTKVNLDTDSLVVVTSFEVHKVRVNGNKAKASILYRVVARSRGDGDIRKVVARNDTVWLRLERTEGRWWILDPPIPRISLKTMIEAYTNIVRLNQEYSKGFLGLQKQRARKQSEVLSMLRSIANQ